jgi:hypothetical protein
VANSRPVTIVTSSAALSRDMLIDEDQFCAWTEIQLECPTNSTESHAWRREWRRRCTEVVPYRAGGILEVCWASGAQISFVCLAFFNISQIYQQNPLNEKVFLLSWDSAAYPLLYVLLVTCILLECLRHWGSPTNDARPATSTLLSIRIRKSQVLDFHAGSKSSQIRCSLDTPSQPG